MSAWTRPLVVACIAASVLVPSASAWTLYPTQPSLPQVTAWAAIPPTGTALPGDLLPAVACPLNDVNADGVGDLLVRVENPSSGIAQLKALAGPDFSTTLWQLATKGQRELHCAPDLNLDGAGDPVTALAGAAASMTPGSKSVDRAVQVLDGATGQALLRRQHQDNDTSAGGGSVAAQSSAAAHLLPASAGAEAFVKTEVQQSAVWGLPSSLPVSSLTTTARRVAELQVLDVKGTVQGVIRIDTPGVDPLAMAPLPVGLGLPDVAVLTAKTASPIEEASQRVPTLSRFNPDGSLAWAVELAGTSGLPILVPRAGDLDLDGVEDLIVETAQTGLQASPASQFLVLSGIDGTQLLSSGSPANGLVAALPLGSLPTGEPAILSAKQVTGAATLTLSALTVTGSVAWSVDVEAGSVPINALTDSYTGDPLGFTDLTGDGLPDVGVAARQGRDLILHAVDGATGKIAWTTSLVDVERVVPLTARDTLGQLTAVGVSPPGDLLAIGNASQAPQLTLIQGTTGEVVWKLKGQLPAGTDGVDALVQPAGDLNGDNVQDLLATLDPRGAGPDETVYALSGSDGATLWAGATDTSKPALPLAAELGPAYEQRAKSLATDQAKGAPTVQALAVLGILAAVAGLRRRRL